MCLDELKIGGHAFVHFVEEMKWLRMQIMFFVVRTLRTGLTGHIWVVSQ